MIPVCAGVFIAADDQTVVVTALPRIMLDLEVQVTELDRASWTITGYLLGYLAAMPLIGRMSDVWGHRLFFLISMVAFMVGSCAVALTQTIDWLIGVRVFQAVGAGALIPISIAIVGDLFPEGKRALPLGIIGATAEMGGVIGPLWGGLMIQYLDWRWIFWMNIPLGIIVLLGIFIFLRSSPRHRSTVDYIGGLLIALVLVSLTLTLSRIGSPDWTMVSLFGVFVVSLAGLIARQRNTSDPLLPSSLFTNIGFNAANVTHLLVGAALIIGMVTIPLMANTVMQLAPFEGGLWLMRLTAAIAVGAVVGGVVCQWVDCRIPGIIGLGFAAVGYFLLTGWGLTISDPKLTIHLGITGLGFGLMIAPVALAGTETVSNRLRGTAASMITAMRIVGMALGLAALAAWGNNRFSTLVADIHLPFPLVNETEVEAQERSDQFIGLVNDAGMNLFQDFFTIAMVICLVAIVPASLMIVKRVRYR